MADITQLEDILIICEGRNVALVEVDAEGRMKVVFHQTFDQVPADNVEAPEETEAEKNDDSYAAQLLGDDTPKFNRE